MVSDAGEAEDLTLGSTAGMMFGELGRTTMPRSSIFCSIFPSAPTNSHMPTPITNTIKNSPSGSLWLCCFRMAAPNFRSIGSFKMIFRWTVAFGKKRCANRCPASYRALCSTLCEGDVGRARPISEVGSRHHGVERTVIVDHPSVVQHCCGRLPRGPGDAFILCDLP